MTADRTAPETGAALGRKDEHLDIVLSGAADRRVGSGLDRVRFVHCAVPELDLDSVDTSTTFLGRAMTAPLLISSMTGGPARAARINDNLAEAAQDLGIALAVGSQRVALDGDGAGGLGGDLRRRAPDIPLLANFGGAQPVAGYGVDHARRAVEMIGADALIVHVNPLQEALQPEGDRQWRGVLSAIGILARSLAVPVVVKEVGNGISGAVAARLVEAGAAVIDVAGAGGTSWAAVEGARAVDPRDRLVADAFHDWGIPTADALVDVRRQCPDVPLIGSGGIRDGVDVARAIRLGADVVGQAGALVAPAVESAEAVRDALVVTIRQLRVAMFCTGSADLAALRRAPLLSS